MSERFFKLDGFNTYYDWDLIVTSKEITPPEPKTYIVELDGADGSLDLTESLTGRVTYKDRKLKAEFWTDKGSRDERERLYRKIVNMLHGKKVKIIEPDDPMHYFLGRITFTGLKNTLAYATFSIDAHCEPWRYSITDSVRRVDVNGIKQEVIISNNGAKTLCPLITVSGSVTLTYNGVETPLTAGSYKIADFKLVQGVNRISLTGNGVITFTYKEADL